MTRALCLLAVCVPLAALADEPVRHPFLCTDNGLGKVMAVDAEGKVTWEYPGVVHCQDVWKLPNGHVLFSHLHGVKEVTLDEAKQVVWEYQAPAGSEVHNCQPLPDGGVLVGVNGLKKLLELDRQGKVRKEVPFETTTAAVHGQMRLVRKLANGHYLLCLMGEHLVRELDGDGQAVRTIKVPGDPFVAIRLPNGNTLIGCGDGHRVLEVDLADTVVWQITENELPGIPLRFVAGLERLANGHTVICNWGGHGHVGSQPQVLEVTPDKQVVWQVADYKTFRTISNIYLLDQPGDPLKGEVLR
jgi:hypothetical protein